MSTKEPLTQPSLAGKKVYLRPLTPNDIESSHLWFMLSEPQSQSCRPLPFRMPAEIVEAYKKKEHTQFAQKFAIVTRKENMLVGTVSFFDLNPLNRSAELGILIDPDEHKNGYATEALGLLVNYLFRYRDLNKVYAQTSEENIATCRLLDKLEFKQDAKLRDHYYFDGEFHAGLIYSLMRYEWMK